MQKEILSHKSICFVIPKFVTFSTGGAELQIYYLSEEFVKRGWRVELICAGIGHEQEIAQSELKNPNIVFHFYKKANIRSLEYYRVLNVLSNTKSYFYYQRTDYALTAAVSKFVRKNNRKMIYSLASNSDAFKGKYSQMISSFSYSNIIKKWIRKIDMFVLDLLIEKAKQRADYILCQNQEQIKLINENFSRDSYLIPNSFVPKENKNSEKENIILWVGNNNPVKRPELFVDLAKRFESDNKWSFVMIGKANELIDDAIIPANLKVLGELSYSLTNEWFAKSKVFINTSEYEGMPNTFIQSWYYNDLILSLNVDPDQVFEKLKIGYCLNGDLEKMFQLVNKVIKGDLNLSNTLSYGEKYFKTNFDINANVDQLIQLLCN